MKQKFLEAMRRLYPEGSPSDDEMQPLLSMFISGWAAGVDVGIDGDNAAIQSAVDQIISTIDGHRWKIDDSWRW